MIYNHYVYMFKPGASLEFTCIYYMDSCKNCSFVHQKLLTKLKQHSSSGNNVYIFGEFYIWNASGETQIRPTLVFTICLCSGRRGNVCLPVLKRALVGCPHVVISFQIVIVNDTVL